MKEIVLHPWRGLRPWKRHSLVLMVAGLVYIGIGCSYIFGDSSSSRAISLEIALRWFSLHQWGVVFILAGTLSIVSSRWPPISKTWGYMVLTGLSVQWAGWYAAGILVGDAPSGNMSAVATWGLIGFMWWAISGLRNPDDVSILDEVK